MPEKPVATLCIVNYKTLDFTRLCLRSIRRFTRIPCEVIVVDNNSADASTEYLRLLKWIRLIERRPEPGEQGGIAHAAALQEGLDRCRTEFFVSMHSDTFVQTDGWLSDLIGYFAGDPQVACVGSGKLELIPRWRMWLKQATDIRTFKRKLLRVPDPLSKHRYYNRTICCLYRTDVLKKENLSFLMDRDKGVTAGKKLYFELVDRGYATIELPPSVMSRYVLHLAHATQVVNPQEFTVRSRTTRKCNRLVRKVMSSPAVQQILNDNRLDD
ncbi:MAG TPA: glycosyltransferase [Phycisphaerales bacterium]|nr:glycosyltransferase [Phycisphaerales bacterium]